MPSSEVYLILLVIGSAIYFLLTFLSKKYNNKLLKTRFRRVIIALSLSPIIYIGIMSILFFYISYYPNEEFNSTMWLENPDKRYEMTDDLIDSELLIGMKKSQVIELLGPTDTTSVTLSYYIGFLPGFNIDPDILVIYFRNDRVINVIQRGT